MRARKTKATFWVAQAKGTKPPMYAIKSGQFISGTDCLESAKRFGSPMGIAYWMGGHISGYLAVKVVATYEASGAREVPRPPEWDEPDGHH